jgi:Tol biopolymer transport system component
MAPSWSPDGRRIAAFMMSRAGGWHAHVVTVDVSDGRREDVGDSRWLGFRDLTWVPDGSGLVLAGYGRTPPAQIWFVPYPAGPPRRVTNDLNGYVSASITADSKALATIQVNQESSLWVASAAHASDARQITPSGSGEPENYVVATANAILFTAAKDGYPYLWSIDYEGTGRVQVSPDRAWIMHADASRDDRTIVFDAIREDGLPHIWTIDRDTGRIIQLTQGGGEVNPSIAPDGTWFAYHIMAPDKASTGPALGPGIFTQRIAGGPPTRIDAAGFVEVVEVSADARRVAYYSMSEGKGGLSRRSLLVAAADGGGPLATLDWPAGFNARWAPSGDALTYVKERDGVGNLWSQPLDGSPSRPITSFTDLEIFSHDWTPDGKRLVLLRGRTTRDAVLISDFH